MGNVLYLKRRRSRVRINITKRADFTLERVRQLIASDDDQTHNQICVTKKGIVYFHIGRENPPPIEKLAFRLECFQPGNGYAGRDAAADTAWVTKVYRALAHNWPDPDEDLIDYF